MSSLTIDQTLKLGPICCALLLVLIFVIYKLFNKEKFEFIDIFIIGTTGSSFPSGVLLIYSGFDSSVVSKISDSNIYIAFAGLALLYVSVSTIKQKFTT
ncbi:hypothetical protein [Aeromonas salmonicida]|uniref:hypothetical protein n=1 Tax=Aeromonas salmonicida TaxID=645 RepID=UPI0011120BB2|nr:hypothetical protein [Aeromonas salmonicida]MDE7527959.1 hypothetical protein [Aeromonas salmonicida]MDE7532309.1 hypothetical protein [Aeromonas salmonicida]